MSSEVTSVTTGVASGFTSDTASTPADTTVGGQSTLPTSDTTSINVTSGTTVGTIVDTSSPSSSTTGAAASSGSGSSIDEFTTIATSTTEISSSDASSATTTPSNISPTISDTSSSTLSTSTQPAQSSSLDLGTSGMTSSTQQQQASTSFTTSFSEIKTTLDSSVTTIFSPIPSLNFNNTSGTTNSRRTAIIVGVVGSVAAVILLCITIVFCCRRQEKRKVDRAHRQLPFLRSVSLTSEDDFDLAGPSSRPTAIGRGLGIFGSLARGGKQAKTPQVRTTSNAHLSVGQSYLDAEEGTTPAMSSYGAPHVSLAALSVDTPENRALDGAPPRLLRPRTSGSGSLFEEQVWPPPRERLRDPLMSASSVNLTSIVDEVMGPNLDGKGLAVGESIFTGPGSTTDVTKSARIRGGAASTSESDSLLVEPDVEELDTLRRTKRESTSTQGGGHTPNTTGHQHDWSVGSQAPLLAHSDGSSSPPSSYMYRHHRNSSESGSWLPPGAARALAPGIDSGYTLGGGSQSAVNAPLTASRSTSRAPLLQSSASGSSAPQPNLWIDRIPRRSIDSKAASERQALRLSVSNPDNVPASPPSPTMTIESVPPPPVTKEPRSPERENTGQTFASSFSFSTSSTQRLKDMQGGDVYAQPTFPDMSEVDPQSPARSLSLGHTVILPASTPARLVDVEEVPEHFAPESMPVSQPDALDEIPPRYDLIRRDTEIAEIQRNLQREGPHEDIGRTLCDRA